MFNRNKVSRETFRPWYKKLVDKINRAMLFSSHNDLKEDFNKNLNEKPNSSKTHNERLGKLIYKKLKRDVDKNHDEVVPYNGDIFYEGKEITTRLEGYDKNFTIGTFNHKLALSRKAKEHVIDYMNYSKKKKGLLQECGDSTGALFQFFAVNRGFDITKYNRGSFEKIATLASQLEEKEKIEQEEKMQRFPVPSAPNLPPDYETSRSHFTLKRELSSPPSYEDTMRMKMC